MNPRVLAGVLRRAYPSFSMDTFENRFYLQKFVFLLQSYGINLGYNFSLYLHGPYSPELTKNGFQIEDYKSIPHAEFVGEYEGKFKKFLKFYEKHKKDVEWLEIASTICMLKKMYRSKSEQAIINELLEIKSGATKNKSKSIWAELSKEGFFAN